MTLSPYRSATSTQAGHTPNTALIRPLIAFDGGNRTTQWIDPIGKICTLPSVIKQIDPAWEDVEADANSVVIHHAGKTFVIGQAAKDLGGVSFFQANKLDLAQQAIFAALEPNLGSDVVRVERLLIAVPHSKNEDAAFLKSIEGTHEFARNDQPIIATVRKVEAIDETKAAYAYARKRGLFLSSRNLNGVLDLGGGTSILRLYSISGALMREADLILPGTAHLARGIAARITRDFPTSPDLTLIMDGIEVGDYQLGTTGYCFESAFESARDEWLAGIRAEIKTRWGEWLPKLGEVLVIGGSAPLASPLEQATRGRFKVAPNPQTISIRGMEAL